MLTYDCDIGMIQIGTERYYYGNPNNRFWQVIAALYGHYCAHPEKMPPLYREIAENEGAGRAACDYISCMTDRFAIETYKELYVPKVWRV